MHYDSEVNSMFDELTVEHLEMVKEDYENINNGYKLYYIIDTYDIINFTLPFVFRRIPQKVNSFTQQSIAYEVIFNRRDRFNFSLMDEYRSELKSIENNLKLKFGNSDKIIERILETLRKNNENISVEELVNEKFIKTNIDLITGLFMFKKHSDTIYDRFNNFIKNNLNTDVFHSGNKHDNIINMTFKDVIKTDFTDKIFDEFCEINKLKIYSLKNDYMRYCYLDNTYRDIVVIDRILSLNKNLKSEKIIFLYLSSPPKKTKEIFKVIENNSVKDIRINRNIMQLFMLNFLLDMKNDSSGKIPSLTKALIDFKKTISSNAENTILTQLNFNQASLVLSLEKSIQVYKNQVEMSFFYGLHNSSRKELEKNLLENTNKENIALFKTLLSASKKFAEEGFFWDSISNTIDPISKVIQTSLLKEKVFYKKIEKIKIPQGDDIIKNSFHNLPFLLFYKESNNNLFRSFLLFLDSISGNSAIQTIDSDEHEIYIQEVINRLGNDETIDTFNKDIIILYFLNIVVAKNSGHLSLFNIVYNESKIIESLERHRSVLGTSKSKFEVELTDSRLSVKMHKMTDDTISEINYFLIWLYRRKCRFEEGIFLCKDMLKKGIEDFRVYHGLGLLHASRAYSIEKIQFEDFLNDFSESRIYLLKAFHLYDTKIKEVENHSVVYNLIRKQQIGILNMMIDIELRIMEHSIPSKSIAEYKNILSICREKINLIKHIIDLLPSYSDYSMHETINHTEVELEYYEALYNYDKSNFIEVLNKLSHANKRIVNFKDSPIVADRFKSIESKINKLRIDAFVELGYI